MWVADAADNFIILLAMPKTLKPAEVDTLARMLSDLFQHGGAAQQLRLMKGLNVQVFSQIICSMAANHALWTKTQIPSLSSLGRQDQPDLNLHLTHFIAIGMEGNQTKIIFDLDRASAREAASRLVGVDRTEDLSPNAAANALGISRTHLRHLMDNGVISSHMVGSHHRIPPAEVARVKAEWDRRSQAMADAEAASADIDT
jgi:excisionase family DNA binding protein